MKTKMETTKKVRFMCAGYFHTDLRMWYRYMDEDGKLYDLYEDEVYRHLHVGDADEVNVSPNFLDIFILREVGDYNQTTKRWNWAHE